MENDHHLRQKAIELLRKRGEIDASLYEKDLEELVEELSIYQIELEHQNNELRRYQLELSDIKNKYADLYNTAPIGYFLIRPDYFILNVNKTACKLLKIDHSTLHNHSFVKFIHPDFQNIFYLHFRMAEKSSESITCDLKMKRGDSSFFYARLLSVSEPVKEGEPHIIRTILLDIDNEKTLELKLTEEKERAKESDRLKSAFLANMSHEIRTPMNSILGFSNLLIEGRLDDTKRQIFSQSINESGKQLMQLIDDILDISKIDANQLSLNNGSVNLFDIINYCYEIVINDERYLTQKELKIDLRFPEGRDRLFVRSDARRLKQVMLNLIFNSLKFTQKGSIEFGIKSIAESSKTLVTFFVKDTGIGIPEEDVAHVFNRFVQAKNNGLIKGTGLGLSISKGIIEIMGGHIQVQSKLGEGTEFSFTLPVECIESYIEPTPSKLSSIDLEGVKMAIAEDDDASFILLRELLSKSNATITRAHNGLELLSVIRREKPQLVLLDINMPEMNGYDALLHIRTNFPEIKVIVQTAYAMSDEREKFLNAGANSYISKPIVRSELFEKIQRVLSM
jgi:signal transduction histidine kinase